MNGEIVIPQEAIAKLADTQKDMAFAKEANTIPLPGPLRDAFSPISDIIVGPYKVRPIVDRDFQYLQILEHPLHKHVNGVNSIADMMRGQPAWESCFMFTRPFGEIKELIKAKGIEGFKQIAADEFGEMGLQELIAINEAIFRQVEIFWAPVIPHKTADEGDSKKNILADGTEPQLTVLVG